MDRERSVRKGQSGCDGNIQREKSELHGKLSGDAYCSKEYIKNIPINVYHDFNGYGCKFAGDERALTPESKREWTII